MAYCNNCGTQLAEGVKFCPKCGTPVQVINPENGSTRTPTPPEHPAAEEEKLRQATATVDAMARKLGDTADSTAEFDPKDIEANKAMALLSYLGILVLVPLFAAKESKFARFHANQGLLLCIAAIIYGVAVNILVSILLAVSWRLAFVSSLFSLVGVLFVVLAVIGIINSLNGKAKELPVIGKYRLLK